MLLARAGRGWPGARKICTEQTALRAFCAVNARKTAAPPRSDREARARRGCDNARSVEDVPAKRQIGDCTAHALRKPHAAEWECSETCELCARRAVRPAARRTARTAGTNRSAQRVRAAEGVALRGMRSRGGTPAEGKMRTDARSMPLFGSVDSVEGEEESTAQGRRRKGWYINMMVNAMKMFALGILVVAIAVLAGHGTAQTDDFGTIAGYTFESDVIDRAEIDLDMADISSLTDASEFVEAKTLYEKGLNSVKADGSIRTIRGLSTSAGTKMTGQPTFDTYEAYWGSPNYGDNFVIQALDGTGMFAAASNIFRAECATKGAQYQIVWMYVIHELEDGRNDCLAGDITDNIGGVQAVDEGWAFYTGSLVGELGTEAGQLVWGLAEKRATNFDTITDGKATVNTRLLELWKKLQASSQSDCANMREDIGEVIRLLLIPLYQGALRYAYRADPASGFGGGSKEWGEGWAFVAALLPMAARENADDAAYIRDNFDPESTKAPVGDGYKAVMDRLYSSAAKLGISEEELGRLEDLDAGGNPGGAGENNVESSGLSGGAIAGIVIGSLVGAALVVMGGLYFWRRQQSKKVLQAHNKSLDHDNETVSSSSPYGKDDYIPSAGP
ncbi:hypothetical protein FVE85_6962 [Porphyridium purpureum]|uniref:Uncharacterized protein n=1 Tax=Porphyridium purpureum TaxID=35688 RepID=A0A5J4Z9R4_PORPP|nr:hypothetical protein FVE85_6962 [Porphyridium purpureum]|eukprot:POR4560..scf295_1